MRRYAEASEGQPLNSPTYNELRLVGTVLSAKEPRLQVASLEPGGYSLIGNSPAEPEPNLWVTPT